MTENTTASGAADRVNAYLDRRATMRSIAPEVVHGIDGPDFELTVSDLRALAASAPVAPTQPATPKGFVLVPVEATEDMKAAAVKYANGTAVYKNVAAAALRIEEGIYGEVYEAMIAAAPKADHIPEAGQKVALLQQGEYLPLPSQPYCHHYHINGGDEGTCYYTADQMHAYVDADRAARGAAQAAPAEPDMRFVALAAGAYTTAYSMLTHAKVHNADVAGSTSRLVAATNGLRSALGQTAPVAEYALRLEGTDMDAERRKMQHYDDPFVMPLDGTQAAQLEGGAK